MNGIGAEALSAGGDLHTASPRERRWTTPGGIPIHFHLGPPPSGPAVADLAPLRLHLEHARLSLLRGFDQLLCLEGLTGRRASAAPDRDGPQGAAAFPRPGAAGRRGRAGQDDRGRACCCASTCCGAWSSGC